MNKYKRFVDKAERIVAGLPVYVREEDKVAVLNRRFRLDREDAKILLGDIGEVKKVKLIPPSKIKLFDDD